MDKNLKDMLDEQATAFNALKAKNEKLARQVDALDEARAVAQQEIQKLDVRLSAPRLGYPSDNDAAPSLGQRQPVVNYAAIARAAFNVATGHHLTSAEDVADYKAAFDSYVRRGDQAIASEARNTLSQGVGSEGGYTCPPDLAGRIIQKVYELDPMRRLADVQLSGADSLEGIIDNDEADAGWVAEQGTREETDEPQIGKWAIPLHELYALPKTTQKLLDDSSWDLDAWIVRKASRRIARVEGTSFVTGTASGQPRGFLMYDTATTGDATRAWDCIQYIPTGAAGAFAPRSSEVSPADVLYDAIYSLKAPYRKSAVWAMTSATAGTIRKLKDGDGNYLWQPSTVAGQPPLLAGYPVEFLESMPAIAANSLSIAFGDFREAYQIADHASGLRLLRDPYTTKGYVKYYIWRRVGGGLVNGEAIKLLKFAAS